MQRIKLQLGSPLKLCSPGQGLHVEEYWPWVGGICKCLRANARGFPWINLPGWPLISRNTGSPMVLIKFWHGKFSWPATEYECIAHAFAFDRG